MIVSDELVQHRSRLSGNRHPRFDRLALHQNSTNPTSLCSDKSMTEKKNPTPKPTIKNTPPIKPPVTSVDAGEPKAPEVKKEEPPTLAPASISKEVETDLVKRFLGALVDGIVAVVVGSIIGFVTGSDFLQYITFGLVMLVRDSLPMLEGQSIGKKVMKTKAVKEDGSSLSGDWATGATRNILMAIPLAQLVECFVILTRSGNPGAGLRLGDEWAKTKVISVE
ncbi:MAG: putative RDD family membrane protein YckC [Akkermansiaceae bacterium]